MSEDSLKFGGDTFSPVRGIKAADIIRDNEISATMDIDPQFVNYIGNAIRRDSRYSWTMEELERLGVGGLTWVKELAQRLHDNVKKQFP